MLKWFNKSKPKCIRDRSRIYIMQKLIEAYQKEIIRMQSQIEEYNEHIKEEKR
jgi:hypothetical protein